MKRLAAIFLSLVLALLFLTGCEGKKVISPIEQEPQTKSMEKAQVINLMENIEPQNLNVKKEDESFIYPIADFSFELFKSVLSKNENTLISPLSIINCFSLVQNGADKETLKQFENTFGMNRDDMNLYLKSFNDRLNKSKSITQANSIWFDSARFTPNQKFLQTNADFFGADIMSSDFNNPDTANNINSWVKKNTDNMIDKIVEKITPDTVMYLINALTFEAKWAEPYSENEVTQGEFNSYSNKKQNADFLNCTVSGYFELKNAKGFKKQYENEKFSFAAILPDENVDIFDFIDTLDSKTFINTIKNPVKLRARTQIPKFKTESDFSDELIDGLVSLGMKDAFNRDKANLSLMGESKSGENLFIGSAAHKTYLELNESGTRAGASTAVTIYECSAEVDDYVKINLNRPFFYAIIDNETGLPVFMGVILSL